MRILFITQWFDPEPMFKGSRFINALMKRGHHVEVVTGFPHYPIGRLYPGYKLSFYRREVIAGITVHRVPLYPSHDQSSLRRMLTYVTFCLSAALFSVFFARRFDVIYAYTPITTGAVGVLAGLVARRPTVIDIQDLWPDTVVKSGMRGTRLMGAVLGGLCNLTYKGATRILSQSQGIKQRLIERGVPGGKIDVIYNFADEGAAVASGKCDLAPYEFPGHFNFVFGGNLGRVQGLDTLIRAAHIAQRDVPNLRLLLIGNGMESDRLRKLVEELQANNITISPAVSSDLIGDVFAAADVLIVHLWDDPLFAITIPQKTMFYLAMGKPILLGVRGEAAEIVEKAGAGLVVRPQDAGEMAEAMVSFARMPRERLADMGRCARNAYVSSFSFDRAVAATEALLQEAIGDGRSIGAVPKRSVF